MNEKFLRLPDVIEATGLAKSTLYALMAQGRFPKQVKLGPKAAAWCASEVEAWQRERIAARSAGRSAARSARRRYRSRVSV